jgi:hypothetical protein
MVGHESFSDPINLEEIEGVAWAFSWPEYIGRLPLSIPQPHAA